MVQIQMPTCCSNCDIGSVDDANVYDLYSWEVTMTKPKPKKKTYTIQEVREMKRDWNESAIKEALILVSAYLLTEVGLVNDDIIKFWTYAESWIEAEYDPDSLSHFNDLKRFVEENTGVKFGLKKIANYREVYKGD